MKKKFDLFIGNPPFVIQSIGRALRTGAVIGNPLFAQILVPTGGGKTSIMSQVIGRLLCKK